MKVLLVEDEFKIADFVCAGLAARGFEVKHCSDGNAGLESGCRDSHDVIVLDIMLPGRDGLSVLKALRAAGVVTPVILLTARNELGDRIEGLNLGADDYLAKPFDLDELEARVRALARRSGAGSAAATFNEREPAASSFCGMHCDAQNGAVYFQGKPMDLAPRESALLRPLLAQAGRAVTRERLFELVFPGQTQVQPEAIEVVAYRLRKKLAPTGAQLVTLRGLGYLLKAAT